MIKDIRKILEKPCRSFSRITDMDELSRKFDLCYYDLGRFMDLQNRAIRLVTQIKKTEMIGFFP